jgi:hypothetical protein
LKNGPPISHDGVSGDDIMYRLTLNRVQAVRGKTISNLLAGAGSILDISPSTLPSVSDSFRHSLWKVKTASRKKASEEFRHRRSELIGACRMLLKDIQAKQIESLSDASSLLTESSSLRLDSGRKGQQGDAGR